MQHGWLCWEEEWGTTGVPRGGGALCWANCSLSVSVCDRRPWPARRREGRKAGYSVKSGLPGKECSSRGRGWAETRLEGEGGKLKDSRGRKR